MGSVRVHLDNPHSYYTNLDIISGKIILNLVSDETIAAIVVKLEGESKTLLFRPPPAPYERQYNRRDDRNRIAMENHKILYQLQQVFPTLNSGSGPTSGSSYTLRAGQHEYPFRFKIPFNNTCNENKLQPVGFGALKLMELPNQYRHVHRTLPPSLSGLPNEAEIRYYVKVTVQRPSIFKENRRNEVGFRFLPIEPPRPLPTNSEVFARRPHAFQPALVKQRGKGMFTRPVQVSKTPPSVLLDARLPSPAILVCREPVPLRLLIKKQGESEEQLYLVGLGIELIGTTQVRALDVVRNEVMSYPVTNLSNLKIPVGNPTDPIGTDWTVDSALWDGIKLPPTVGPSFEACNIDRSYELEAKVTLGWGVNGVIQVCILQFSSLLSFLFSSPSSFLSPFQIPLQVSIHYCQEYTNTTKPQTQLLPLRFPIQVYSGVSPPAALLDRLATRPPLPDRVSTNFNPKPGPRPGVAHSQTSAAGPSTGAIPSDAPPSYEDAMADEIGPVDGPRREFSGVGDVDGPRVGDGMGMDRNSSGGGDEGDQKAPGYERLFPGSKGRRPSDGGGV
jgi:hypothetical protein